MYKEEFTQLYRISNDSVFKSQRDYWIKVLINGCMVSWSASSSGSLVLAVNLEKINIYLFLPRLWRYRFWGPPATHTWTLIIPASLYKSKLETSFSYAFACDQALVLSSKLWLFVMLELRTREFMCNASNILLLQPRCHRCYTSFDVIGILYNCSKHIL